MIAGEATETEKTALRSNGQFSKAYIAGLDMPPIVFQARINQAVIPLDRVAEVAFDSVTAGAYTDVLVDQTVWIGLTVGGCEIGIARVRKAATSDTLFIGETSQLALLDNQYITVFADYLPWPKHMHVDGDGNVLADYDIEFDGHYTDFEPVPVMGSDWVVKLKGADVSIEPQDAGDSWVFGSTITGWSWYAPGASASSGMTTASPAITYDAEGNYHLYLSVTAANGKSYIGVRTVYVVENPRSVMVREVPVDYEEGGTAFEVELYSDVDKSLVRDRARVILWSDDWFAGTRQSIGFEPGHENIIAAGWIDGETVDMNVEGGTASFTVKGAQWWMDKIELFPTVLNFATNTSSAWNQMPSMTIDRGVWYLLHVLSNITRIMDVRLTGDTRLKKVLDSSAESLWGAIHSYAEGTIFAKPFVDANGRFTLAIEPQMVPVADRASWPVIMEIGPQDLENSFDPKKVLVNDTSQIDISGKICDASGREKTCYSFSFGHIPGTHGNPITSDNLVVSSQAQLNQLAGLLNGWRNNPYPDIELRLAANFRIVSLMPHQFIHLAVSADHSIRGEELTFNIIPRSVTYEFNAEAGCITTVINGEMETGESLSTDGDIPNVEEDFSNPPITTMPGDPTMPPGTNSGMRPKKVVMKDAAHGLLQTENGDAEDPNDILWEFCNGGLDDGHKAGIDNILITSYGKIYLGYIGDSNYNEIWCAAMVSAAFNKIADAAYVADFYGTSQGNIVTMGLNPLASDQVAFIGQMNNWPYSVLNRLFIGNADGFTAGALQSLPVQPHGGWSLSFGSGKWCYTGWSWYGGATGLYTFDAAGDNLALISMGAAGSYGAGTLHVRAGSTGKIYILGVYGGNLWIIDGNGATLTDTGVGAPDGGPYGWRFAVEPTGAHMMSNFGTVPSKSSDFGYTWSAMTAILPIGQYAFGWAKYDAGRFVAALSDVHFTPDFGTTWETMTGNLRYLIPTPNIQFIQVIE